MKNLAYLRVSTAHQDVQSQRLAILEYAREEGFEIDRFKEEPDYIPSSPCASWPPETGVQAARTRVSGRLAVDFRSSTSS